MPCPHRPEGIEETDVFKQVWIEPQSWRNGEHGDDEQNQPDNGHGEEQSYQSKHAHAKVPYTLPEYKRPQRE